MGTRAAMIGGLVVLAWGAPLRAAPGSDAYRAAFAATFADPTDLEKALDFASVALREGDIEGAIGALERVLLVRPDLTQAQLQLGGLYLRIGAHAQARAYVDAALATPSLDPTERRQAEALRASVDARDARHRIFGSISLAGGYQSNANSAPSAQSVSVGGTTYTLTSEERARADGNGFVAAAVGYVYDPKLDSGLTVDATLAGSVTQQIDVTDYDLATVGVAVGPRLPLSNTGDGANVWVYGVANLSTLAEEVYGLGAGGGVTASTPLARGLWTDVVVEAVHLTYRDGDVAPSASDQTGFAPRAALQLRYRVFDHLWLIAAGLGATARAAAADQATVSFGGIGGVSVPFRSPFSASAPAASLDVVYLYQAIRYDEADADVDPDTRREDGDHRISGLLRLPFAAAFSFFLTGGYTDHPSNLETYRYSGAFASGGVTCEFGGAP